MVNQNSAPVSDMGEIGYDILNPSTWVEPKESYPGIVRKFELRWSRPEYNAATEFRPAFPMRKHPTASGGVVEHNSIKQLDIVVERLDAVYIHEDGSAFDLPGGGTALQVPVNVYSTVDLERFNEKKGTIEPITRGLSKAKFTIDAWIKVIGALTSDVATRVPGQMFQFDFFREKEIVKGNPAKKVLVPVSILPPTYAYTGEVQRFKASRRDDVDDAAVATAASAGFTASAPTAPEDAAKVLAEFIESNGLNANDPSLLGHPGFPAVARMEPFISKIASGKGAEALAQFGL